MHVSWNEWYSWYEHNVVTGSTATRLWGIQAAQRYIVGFVAAAVSMPMGGCRARSPVGVSSVAVVAVDVAIVAVRLAVL